MRSTRRRRAVGVHVLLLLISAAGCAAAPANSEISQAELSERIEQGASPVVLDVRTPDEYASGHVPGAVNIPHDLLASRFGELGSVRDEELVVYCESGRRAAMAAGTLKTSGFTQIRHLTGDMSAWRGAGLPMESAE